MSGVGQRETVVALLERSARANRAVPIRRSFVQDPARGGGPGPLAAFVSQRRGRALDLYLLAHAVASAPPYDVRFPALVWARALGLSAHSSTETLISRSWSWLEAQRLIESRRVGRMRQVTILREDGSGGEYTHPGDQSEERRGHYFQLPFAYWEGNFHNRLSLPAKAALLIGLSLRDDFLLPTERGMAWYGISRDTVRKGLRDLRLLGILEMREFVKEAPLSTLGYTRERRYALREPFRSASAPKKRPRSKRAAPKADHAT